MRSPIVAAVLLAVGVVTAAQTVPEQKMLCEGARGFMVYAVAANRVLAIFSTRNPGIVDIVASLVYELADERELTTTERHAIDALVAHLRDHAVTARPAVPPAMPADQAAANRRRLTGN